MTPDPGVKGEWANLAVTGAGVGAATWVSGTIKKYLPGVTVEDSWVQILAGLGLYYYGGRWHWALEKFGAGVMLNGIGTFVKTYIPVPQYAQAAQVAPAPQVYPQLSPEQMLHNLAAAAAQQGTPVYGTAKFRSTFIPEVMGQ